LSNILIFDRNKHKVIKTFDNEIVTCQIWAEIEAVYVIPEKITDESNYYLKNVNA